MTFPPRQLFILLIGSLLAAAPAWSQQVTLPERLAAPACSHCQAKLHTIDALRQTLPADWQLHSEHDPVLGGKILVVQAGRGNTQTLVLVHGLGANGFTDWLDLIPRLARQYHVVAFDLPGFGYSDSPDGKYSPRNLARVLSGVVDRHARGRAIVVGHSLGGAVALRFASDFPAQLDKLILVDAAGILHRTAFVKHNARIRLEPGDLPDFLKNPLARLQNFGAAAVENLVRLPDPTRLLAASDTLWTTVLAHQSNLNAALALVDEDFSRVIPAVATPTWILWGDADPVAPLRTGQMLAYLLPQAELRVLPGAGHTPMEAPTAALFYRQLEHALNNDPQRAASEAAPAGELPDLRCDGQTDRSYGGHYREVLIEDCKAIRLHNLVAQRVVIRHSTVQALNLQISGGAVGLDLVDSALVATGGKISADIALRADQSRLDLAGLQLDGRHTAVEVQGGSRLIGSSLTLNSPAYRGPWQGSVDIENGVLVP